MYGAIFGDIVGSSYEHRETDKTKLFRLFTEESRFTDDTVMTLAVAKAFIEAGPQGDEEGMKTRLIENMKNFGRAFPDAGYGAKFQEWLRGEDTEAYGSFGNGSAMRVSMAGWLFDSIERTREVARWSAEVTHNHPEGVKGAEAIATVIFLIRNDWNNATISHYIQREFGYDLTKSLEDLRKESVDDVTCAVTVPQAIRAFLEAEDFEDAIRNAVSLGGDTDTLACMAGSMAEARFEIPEEFMEEVRDRLPEKLVTLLDQLEKVRTQVEERRDVLHQIHYFLEDPQKERLIPLLRALEIRMKAGCLFFMPVELPEEEMTQLSNRFPLGSVIPLARDIHPSRRSISTNDGKRWLAAFTSVSEGNRGDTKTYYVGEPMSFTLQACLQLQDCAGVVINAWGERFFFTREMIEVFLSKKEPEVHHDQAER
ncbi:MAG: ADP-ribosylglycohydrolase family protein [Lachnospiraceae bacterium]|nr:ADP-ribosylglycohydrolase family protein [Lachnospiraceae bacterium]